MEHPDYYKAEPETDEDWARRTGTTLPEDDCPTMLVDEAGNPVQPLTQPLAGSVVLVQGVHGTAWQRHFSDLLWHSTRGGRPRTWREMLAFRNVILVYRAPVRG